MSSQRKERKRRSAELQRAVNEMRGIRRELEQAYNCFDHMVDPDRMDACIFEINALRARYNCAVQEIRKI